MTLVKRIPRTTEIYLAEGSATFPIMHRQMLLIVTQNAYREPD